MKTKSEIRRQIRQFYAIKKRAKEVVKNNEELELRQLEQPFQIFDYCILSLKWALGYKVQYKGYHYWCFRCHIMHQDSTCPKCGSNRILSLKEEI